MDNKPESSVQNQLRIAILNEKRELLIQDLVLEAKYYFSKYPSISINSETRTLEYNDKDDLEARKLKVLQQNHDPEDNVNHLFNFEYDLARRFYERMHHKENEYLRAGINRIKYLLENQFIFNLILKRADNSSLFWRISFRDEDLLGINSGVSC